MNLVAKNKNVFLTKKSKINTSEKINIILSPEFYWVRVFKIPINKLSKVKSVLPNLFEEVLGENVNLTYQAIKLEDNNYMCFAFDNEKIFEFIKQLGINTNQIKAIYFAQIECKNFKNFYINDNQFLYTENDVLLLMPKKFFKSNVNLEYEINNIELSSHKVNLKFYSNSISFSKIKFLIFICLGVLLINIFKIVIIKNSISNIENKINLKILNNELPNSILRMNSIFDNINSLVNKQIKKRKFLQFLFDSKIKGISKIDINSDICSISVSNGNKENIKRIISKRYKIVYIKEDTNNVQVKVKI